MVNLSGKDYLKVETNISVKQRAGKIFLNHINHDYVDVKITAPKGKWKFHVFERTSRMEYLVGDLQSHDP